MVKQILVKLLSFVVWKMFLLYMDSAPWKLFGHYDCGTIICFGVFDLNMAKQILVKLWFLVVGNMFLLYVWIQHPGKSLGYRDCGEFTIQICNSNKFLPNSKQILKENISRKNTKKICYGIYILKQQTWNADCYILEDFVSNLTGGC